MIPRRSIFRFMLSLSGCGLPGLATADHTFYRGRTEYILVTTARTWDQAEADAVAKGGHLAQVNDAAENTFLLGKTSGKVTTAAPDGGGAKYVWIGGKETTTEGSYAWAAGGTFWAGGSAGSAQNGFYQKWGRLNSPREPDNYGGIQNRVAMALENWPAGAASGQEIGRPGQWNDVSGGNLLNYIIERPITKPAEGLFAVFEMTHGGNPAGSFTCQLHYDRAPIAVANFITLAEGSRSWIDASHGRVSNQPLYPGSKCHRILSGFMIQGGDPLGNGSGGPGYRFVDEFSPDLRHDHPGVLSMANSGVNTNGSQFFVTVSETTHLDDKHTIFGQVVEGYESCVVPLSNVPTRVNPANNAPEIPVQDVLVRSITIERLGAAAQAFDPLDPALGLPLCSMRQTRLERGPGGTLSMHWTEPAHCSYTLLDSADLAGWEGQKLNYYSGYDPVAAQDMDVTAVPPPGAPRHFFQLAEAIYTPLPGPSPQGRKFILTGTPYLTTITVTGATSGTHRIQGPGTDLTSTLSNVTWEVSGFDTARFTSDISPAFVYPYGGTNYNLTHSDWRFTFRTPTSGTFTGGFYVANRLGHLEQSGTFTVQAVP